MVNHCIRIGLQNDVHTLKKLSKLSYQELRHYYDIPSYYKLCAISKAAGILSNRKQSIKRGIDTKKPYLKKPILVSCYGFKYENGTVKIPLGNQEYFDIPFNNHSKEVLSNDSLKIDSFTLTLDSISISYSKEVAQIECTKTMGVDRNLRNITIGNCDKVIQFDISKTVDIVENTKSIYSSFKRNDHRIRKKIYLKYGIRRKNRTTQVLHRVSKTIVEYSKKNRESIVFEDLKHIRRLYQRSNGHSRRNRSKMNSWPFFEIKRQIEYKSRWNGVPIIQLSKKETRGTSSLCPRCGKRLQEKRACKTSDYNRELWCKSCQRWLDRDVVAVMNQSLRGLLRFGSSKGDASEAMVQESGSQEPVILKVDASKLHSKDELNHLKL
jgi:putative transposase